ncbi:MAG TPA: hypothetical protein VHA82_12325 [Ramlibacter sp.]|uniref:hypothetical protein n=1 Tax=Ramlibacter sp. TaxID=1917967 RepID=UPI002BD149BA|nr:hypothetical protein [Ramlibacter sp.]HVZ44587.1 hypothetical protein [Ramlibacter sp.]
MVKLNEIAKLAVKKNDEWSKPVERGPEIDKAADEFVDAARKILNEAGSVEGELDNPRGHKELYSLLGKMWGLVRAVDESPARLEVIARVKAELKAADIGFDEKAPFSKLLLRFSFRGKRRQLAHVYGRVFEQARRKNIEPAELAEEIENAKGIQKFARTVEQEDEEKRRKAAEKARVAAMAKLVESLADANGVVVEWADDPLKAGAGESAQFAVFVGLQQGDGRYALGICADVGQSQETTLIKWLLTAYKKASTEAIVAEAEALAGLGGAEEMMNATGSVEVAQ